MQKLALALALALIATGAHAQDKAGQVLFTSGKVERVAASGAVAPLAGGDAVYEGDLLRTAPGAHVQLSMRDEGFLALRPGTELRLKRYGDGRAVLEIVKGTLRSITGSFGRRDRAHYRLEGREVVLGIRGTDHEATQRDEGFYDRVIEGGTYLAQEKGRIEVAPGQTGFAPARRDGVPSVLPRTPEFVLATLPPAAAHDGPAPRESAPLDRPLPQLPAAARFDTPPVGGPLEHPGATVTGTGVGARPSVVLPDVARPGGKGRN